MAYLQGTPLYASSPKPTAAPPPGHTPKLKSEVGEGQCNDETINRKSHKQIKLEGMETEYEKGNSPLVGEGVRGQSSSPDSKRKWHTCQQETTQEYESRKKARHAELTYVVDFGECTCCS